MLTLITGEPGGSKTLNTIKMICEGELYQNRPVYYFGIKELTLDWNELSKDDVQKWFELPENSVIVIDEAQYHFPPRRTGTEQPTPVLEMSTHRHRGYDLFIITQHPTLIDASLRKYVGQHFHYERPFSTNNPRRLQFQTCANDPQDYHARQTAVTEKVKLDKKYFGVYKSAEVHTHKFKVPKKVIMVGVAILLFCAGLFHFYGRMTDKYASPQVEQTKVETVAPVAIDPEPKEIDYDNYWVPRVAGLPHTAPAYDGLNVPVTKPMPQCIIRESTRECVCYTQQATKMDVPHSVCYDIVRNGFFDPSRPDHNEKGRGGQQAGRHAAAASSHIPHKPSPARPLRFL